MRQHLAWLTFKDNLRARSGEPTLNEIRLTRPPFRLAVAAYLLAVGYVTLVPRFGVSGPLSPNFIPFASIVDLLFNSEATPALMVKNLLGNVLLLAPLGVFLYAGLCWTWLRALRCVVGVSLSIEIIQGVGLTDGRQANVDDLLLNLVGACAGMFLVRAWVKHNTR